MTLVRCPKCNRYMDKRNDPLNKISYYICYRHDPYVIGDIIE